jgi:hypothetical protein
LDVQCRVASRIDRCSGTPQTSQDSINYIVDEAQCRLLFIDQNRSANVHLDLPKSPGYGDGGRERDVKDFALREGPAFSHLRHMRFLDALPVAAYYKYDGRSFLAQSMEIVHGEVTE